MTSPLMIIILRLQGRKQTYSMLPWLYLVTDHRARQHLARTSATHSAAHCVPVSFFFYQAVIPPFPVQSRLIQVWMQSAQRSLSFLLLAHCRVFSLYTLFSSLSLSAKSSARVFSEEQIYDDVDISLTLPLKSVIFKMMFTSERTRNLGHINIYNYVMLARSCFKTSRAFGLA